MLGGSSVKLLLARFLESKKLSRSDCPMSLHPLTRLEMWLSSVSPTLPSLQPVVYHKLILALFTS